MIARHPEIAHIEPATAGRALHEVIGLAFRHPSVGLNFT